MHPPTPPQTPAGADAARHRVRGRGKQFVAVGLFLLLTAGAVFIAWSFAPRAQRARWGVFPDRAHTPISMPFRTRGHLPPPPPEDAGMVLHRADLDRG